MWPLDRSTVQEGPYVPGRRTDAPARYPEAEFAGLGDDDPLAAARGAVNGALFGSLVWAVVLWALL